ncbi:enoyl-CoA hydratase [Sandarakinorhabdus limnophila]|uniref:enoyl-CoA hydratase n=1 Tax=Sandarakinorhabdus limnophila TaxID=210512 RepID=UPI0026EAD804|nr:enoyl-CoA hydratase [Sandarakinorhabdus limnophila]
MSEDVVLVSRDGPVANVTLNRPQAMNALSQALRRDLARVFRELEADDDVRAIVLTGAGTRAFTAGLDLKELGQQGLGAANAEGPDDNPVKAIEQTGKPVIGAINGVAITGGFEVALACDVLIGSENARFADTHARVGIMPGWGLSQKLSRLIGPYRARELSLSGNFLDAATAERWGLLNRVVPADNLVAAATKLAHDMASIAPGFARGYKKLINDGYELPFGQAMALEAERSTAANAKVSAAEVEAGRGAVQARGRQQ